MKEDVSGYEVLVEGRIKLLQVIDSAGFENPDDFSQGALPIRHVMKDAEAEDGVQRPGSDRETQDIGHIKRDFLSLPLREIGLASPEHLEVQVHGLEHRGLELFPDDGGPRAAPAAYFQDHAPACQGPASLHPANLESLLNGTGGVVDRPSFSPVEFHSK